MAFQVSPGVNVSEIDLTNVIPAVATTTGAIAGVFRWGPVKERILIDSETTLAARFGRPFSNTTWGNAETFFTAASFLAYGNSLYATRVTSNTAYNAGANSTLIETREEAELYNGSDFIARYPGALGNSLMVSVCDDANSYSSSIANVNISLGATTATTDDVDILAAGDILRVGNSTIGYQNLTVTAVVGNTDITFTPKYRLSTAFVEQSATRFWGFYNSVDGAPSTGNVHIAVVDEDGTFTGESGAILELYENVSLTSTAKLEDGTNNYYKEVINSRSAYIYATGDTVTVATGIGAEYASFTGGADGADESNIAIADLAFGYDLYDNAEEVDISLVMAGKARGATLANYIIDNIVEIRKDCVVFISPERSDVVNNPGSEVTDTIAFRNALTSSSYAILDSGYKYIYDKYNDLFRYVPLNGDIAGLTARTDTTRDPWFSPAGINRGIIKNAIKLAWSPNKAERDELYKVGVNPVIVQPGSGIVLYGDKTLLGRASAFDRINVRRLFIVLEKAIANASKAILFEFNDEFTRAQFRNLVEPFLRDVQGRRGIFDFRVVCDETNNTPEVIDRNEFRGDIYIKPARSINFIQLNFVAVRTGVEFEEIVGAF